MKKLLFTLLLMCISLCTFADVFKYQATGISLRCIDDTGYWTDWTAWEKCSILVVINTNSDIIDIYSAEQQQYDIYSYDGKESDGQGGTQLKFSCVDAEGTRCAIAIRTQKDGQMQLYIYYSNASIAYNIQQK